MGVRVIDVCIAGLALWLFRYLIRRRTAPSPPGPPRWPFIGNLLNFPIHAPYKGFVSMGQKYGPVMSLTIMGRQYVVLNSARETNDLLVKKSAITSNRSHFTMGIDLVGWGNATIFQQYGEQWQKHRCFFHRQIGTKSSLKAFHPDVEAQAKRFIHNLLEHPNDLIFNCQRTAGSVILKISHGYNVQKLNDPLVEMADRAMHNFTVLTTPGRFFVDNFPILRYLPEWFPGGGFRKEAKKWRKMLNETADTPHAFVLQELEKGDVSPSFTSRLLQEGVSPEEEEILKWASFSMYLGGSDTTPAALSAFFLAMTIYPNVLQKAQAEIDCVVGHTRLPTVQDRDALPYVNAVCTELLRWHVVAPFTVHVTTEDIVYDGYFIPKGTSLIGNIWSILSDPETYPNPDVFDPERFLGDDRQPDPRKACFGWGRRSCPGMHLADLTIFMSVAMVLATLNISRRVEHGVEQVPRYEVEEGIIRHIKSIKCKIVARSGQAEDLLIV